MENNVLINLRINKDFRDSYRNFCKYNNFDMSKRIRELIKQDMENKINNLSPKELEFVFNTIHDSSLQTEANPFLWIVYDKNAQQKVFDLIK